MESEQYSNPTQETAIGRDMSRRRFMGLSAIALLGLTAVDWIHPASASANDDVATQAPDIKERYRIFVPNAIVASGGTQTLVLRSGETYEVPIPRRIADQTELTIKGQGLQGKDIVVILHTLFDPNRRIQVNLMGEIETVNFIEEGTKQNCKDAYFRVLDGKPVQDIAALDLLDYVIASSKLDEKSRQRYEVASQNSRLFAIEEAIADVLGSSELDEAQKKTILGTYQYVRAADPVPDFKELTELDAIVEGSDLPTSLKRIYAQASATSRAFTLDFFILDSIETSKKLSRELKEEYQEIYQQVRNGQEVQDLEQLAGLDKFIVESPMVKSAKFVYFLARSRFFDIETAEKNNPVLKAIANSKELTKDDKEKLSAAYNVTLDPANAIVNLEIKQEISQDTVRLLDSFMERAKIPPNYRLVYDLSKDLFFEENPELAQVDWRHELTREVVKSGGGAIVPVVVNIGKFIGVEAGTGVTISTLSGAAATNATLAALGGGSVAAGGLGMMGGLVVVTGGAALIGAAGLLSVALVSQMDGKDLRNLGVAGLTGTLAGVAAVFVAWTGASALGVAGTLSGAAAITAMITSLGGLSVITGGVSLIAFGTGFVVWSFLNGHKSRDNHILHQLEARVYTLLEEPSSDPLFEFLKTNLPQPSYNYYQVFIAPDIPLDKLTTAIDKCGKFTPGEKVLAFIDTSIWQDAKKGIFFTNKGIVGKDTWEKPESLNYKRLNTDSIAEVSKLLLNEEEQAKFEKLLNQLRTEVFLAKI